MNIIDLNKDRGFIQGYVNLRNMYTKELETKPITVESTIAWMDSDNGGLIRCFCDGDNVIAAVIVHRRREITLFSYEPGMGNNLLTQAEKIGVEMGFDLLWASTREDNAKAAKAFLRNGYKFKDGIYSKSLHTREEYGMKEGAAEFPMMVVLSFSYVCNAKCPNCPYNNSDIRKDYKDAKFMSTEVFEHIANECGPYGSVLRFSGGGEPMLHPRIRECLDYAKYCGCKTSVITNGSKDVSNILHYTDVVEFSVDAGNKEDYAKARPGLDWEFLNKNVERAMSELPPPKIIASIINQKGIDVDAAYKYWVNKVDNVQVRKYLTWGLNKDESANDQAYLPPEERIPCPWLFERLNIDSVGNVNYCGEDIAFNHKIANIKDRSIKEIWNGEEFAAVRKLHLERRGDEVKMCSKCPDWKYRTWNYNYWKLTQ